MSNVPGGGPIDTAVLTQLAQNARRNPVVRAATLEPTPQSPTQLRITIDAAQYPAKVDTVRVDVRWFETGDFSFHYVERHVDETTWQCRWNRHPNPHSQRTHFHEPPETSAVRDFPVEDPYPMETLHLVLDWIEGRIERLWE